LQVALVGWEEDDEPIIEHKVHSPNCPLVIKEEQKADSESRTNKHSRTTQKETTEASKEGKTMVVKSKTSSSSQRKRCRNNLSAVPCFDRILEKRQKKINRSNDTLGSSAVPPVSTPSSIQFGPFPSEFRTFSSTFLRKIILSSFSKE